MGTTQLILGGDAAGGRRAPQAVGRPLVSAPFSTVTSGSSPFADRQGSVRRLDANGRHHIPGRYADRERTARAWLPPWGRLVT